MIKLEFRHGGQVHAEISLPLSKSECNRALILSAWSGGKINVNQLSEAADSQLLQKLLLQENTGYYDAEDAGTTLRFLTSFLALSGRKCIISGSERMQNRPIGELVDALRKLGCRISYTGKEGFPPLELSGFSYSGMHELEMENVKSSQFVSSLMMAAPALPEGISIRLEGKTGSFPYLELTASLMKKAGLRLHADREFIRIPPQPWNEVQLSCGADWSAASYWYAILACLPEGSSFDFPGLEQDSTQGDRIAADLATFWNVQTQAVPGGIRIIKGSETKENAMFSFSFHDCPDLALTFICLCAASGRKGDFSGLSSLSIKESDRLQVIREELNKAGTELKIHPGGDAASLEASAGNWPVNPPQFECHGDHRIAMALSILLAGKDRSAFFSDERVVGKSYPSYWKDLQKACFIYEPEEARSAGSF
jgi:3-phosphoshikimate 1-carboxyvinyltransferase